MNKPELALSNATSFFMGGIEETFRNARKYGFKYVEIAPYRWTTAKDIKTWEAKYGVEVAGIHLPFVWQSVSKVMRSTPIIVEKIAIAIVQCYLGNATTSPSTAIAKQLSEQQPYFLIHRNVADDMGTEKFQALQSQFHVVIENIPEIPELTKNGVFDHNHFIQARKRYYPNLDIFQAYRQAQPEVIHISYDNLLPASLPNLQQQEELKTLLQIHRPKYITIETNPLINIKKGKKLLDQLVHDALG